MKKLVRLTEGDLHRIIENSVKRVLRESDYDDYDVYEDEPYLSDDANQNVCVDNGRYGMDAHLEPGEDDYDDGYSEPFDKGERARGYKGTWRTMGDTLWHDEHSFGRGKRGR